MVIAVCGAGDNEKWLKKIKDFFGKIESKKPIAAEKAKESQKNPQIKIHHKTTDQAHFIIGFRSIKRTDKRRPILKVLSNIMGENMSSRLFSEVREKLSYEGFVHDLFSPREALSKINSRNGYNSQEIHSYEKTL